MIPLTGETKIVECIESKSRMVVARCWKEEDNGGLLITERTVSVKKMTKFWRPAVGYNIAPAVSSTIKGT